MADQSSSPEIVRVITTIYCGELPDDQVSDLAAFLETDESLAGVQARIKGREHNVSYFHFPSPDDALRIHAQILITIGAYVAGALKGLPSSVVVELIKQWLERRKKSQESASLDDEYMVILGPDGNKISLVKKAKPHKD